MFPEKWITSPNHQASPFYARKAFRLDKEPDSAEILICGLGQFILSLNGEKVGDHELDPAWTDYRKEIQFLRFDVTKHLHAGVNAIGVEVGNGWYSKMDEGYTFAFPPFMPKNPNPYVPFGECLPLALTLTVCFSDGTRMTLCADETFRVSPHPATMSNVFGSETLDGRLEQEGWNEGDFDDSAWECASPVPEEDIPQGIPREQTQPPVRVIKTYEARSIKPYPREVYDFGQNMSGILELELFGKCGDRVSIYPAEKLTPEGDVDQTAKNWARVDSVITCILGKDDAWQRFRMKFTYFAGRYVALKRVPRRPREEEPSDGGIRIRCLRAHAITSAWKQAGKFHCDHEPYNEIYAMIERTVEANLLSVHTDCPTIERFAWQEPNHLMAPSIFFMKDGRELWDKFLRDMRNAQHSAEDYFLDYEGNRFYPGEGMMPSQAPCYIPNVLPVPGMGSFYDIIPWGSTCILGTYWHYLFYGDEKIIEKNFEAGARYLAYLKTKRTEEGFISHGLGDWGNPRKELARENIETAFLYADAKILGGFARILGKEREGRELESFAREVMENYNKRLLVFDSEKGLWYYRTRMQNDGMHRIQAAQALPLFWGMVPKDKEEDVVRALRLILEEEGAFISGEIGLPYIIQTARKYGFNDLICEFITKREHPSYYAFVLDGMTTLGEYWEKNPRSHCHDMLGHIIEWYYNGIAGILLEEPGFKKVTIRPYLPEGMHRFTCSYPSVRGEIFVSVEETRKAIFLETRLPVGIDYKIDTVHLAAKGKKVYKRN